MSQTTGVAEQLERIVDALETHTLLLRQIAESNIGQWGGRPQRNPEHPMPS